MELLKDVCAHFGLHLTDDQREHALSLTIALTSVLTAIGLICLYVFPVANL